MTCKHRVFGEWSSVHFAFFRLTLFEGRQRTDFERTAVEIIRFFTDLTDDLLRERFSNSLTIAGFEFQSYAFFSETTFYTNCDEKLDVILRKQSFSVAIYPLIDLIASIWQPCT